MTSYAIYDLASGLVHRIEQDENEPADLPESLAFVALQEVVTAWPTEPFAGAQLKVMNGALTWADPRTLEQTKANKWEEVKQWRTDAIDTNMTTPYGVFQCRAEDRQNISDSVLLANAMATASMTVAIVWTLADNSTVTLDQTKMTTVGLLLGQKVQAAHARARTLRTEIDSATTAAQVDALTWSQ